MSIVWLLIPVSLILVGCGVWAFFWAVRTGQFDELDVPGWEILIEESDPPAPTRRKVPGGPDGPHGPP